MVATDHVNTAFRESLRADTPYAETMSGREYGQIMAQVTQTQAFEDGLNALNGTRDRLFRLNPDEPPLVFLTDDRKAAWADFNRRAKTYRFYLDGTESNMELFKDELELPNSLKNITTTSDECRSRITGLANTLKDRLHGEPPEPETTEKATELVDLVRIIGKNELTADEYQALVPSSFASRVINVSPGEDDPQLLIYLNEA
jgi:hypothetical protein